MIGAAATGERMCPCGNCDATWEQAVREMMRGPAALNRDQAEALLEQMVAGEKGSAS